jgi:hypothetical protein
MLAPNLIFIVDEDDLPARSSNPFNEPAPGNGYVPNFTCGKPRDGVIQVASRTVGTETQELAQRMLEASTLIVGASFPLTRLISAALGYAFASDTKPETDEVRKRQETELGRFLERHAVSERAAQAHSLRFAPGHPRVGEAYRLHPLAGTPGANRDLFYIPEASFDQVLLEEREAELLRLLVQLGATRIAISERQTRNSADLSSASVSVSATGVGEANAAAAAKTDSKSDDLHTREFQLVGRQTGGNDRIDEAEFAWLGFEPSWKSLVWARERGQCTRAVIELKEETAYSNERQLSAGLKAAAYGGASAAAAKALSQSAP